MVEVVGARGVRTRTAVNSGRVVQGIQGRKKREGQRLAALLPPLGWSAVVAGQSNR